jgi:hypothetical protein
MKFNSTHVILAVLLLLPGRLQTGPSHTIDQHLPTLVRNSCTKIRQFCRSMATEHTEHTNPQALQKYKECMKSKNDERAQESGKGRKADRCDGENGGLFDHD